MIVLITVVAAFGQTEKGNFFLSGATSMQFSSIRYEIDDEAWDDKIKINSFSILPAFGIFVADDIAIGLSAGFSSKKDVDLESTRNTFAFMPTLLYYFPVDGKLRPFAQAGLGYLLERDIYENRYYDINSSDSRHKTDEYNGLVGNLGVGVSYFITEKISFDFGLRYTRLSKKTDSYGVEQKYSRGEFGSNVGFSMYF